MFIYFQNKNWGISEIMKTIDLQLVIEKQLYHHHFQPIFNMKENKIIGYEALLRTSNARHNPEYLFRRAIEMGQLTKLDSTSLLTALQTFASSVAKNKHERSLLLALNVYGSTLVSATFLQRLQQVIHNVGIKPEQIMLELNESEPVYNYSSLQHTIHKLKDTGIQIALDDVGKGYSATRRIIELEPTYIKLDKYFLNDIHQSVMKQDLLKLLVDFSVKHNVQLIIEGVEIEADLMLIESLGIQYGQGFLLGKPATLEYYEQK